MTKLRLGNLSDQIDIAGNANAELNRLLIENLYTMAERITQLEARLDCLSDAMTARNTQFEARLDRLTDLTVGESEQPFDEMVLEVLTVRSGSAREALGFEDAVMSAIEENSYTTFTHIEAEIDGKLEDMTQTYDFAAAVEEAVKGSIVSTVEDVIAELGVIDPEEIVRQGLKAII